MSYLKSVIDAILALFAFLGNIIAGTLQMLANIPTALQMLVSTIGYMPTILVGFAMALVTINVVYLIVGR